MVRRSNLHNSRMLICEYINKNIQCICNIQCHSYGRSCDVWLMAYGYMLKGAISKLHFDLWKVDAHTDY